MWDADDVDFLRQIATGGSRNAEFVGLRGGSTVFGAYFDAFHKIIFRPPKSLRAAKAATGGVTFGMRIEEHKAFDEQGGGPLPTLALLLANQKFVL